MKMIPGRMFWELTCQHLQLFINKWKTEDQKASFLCVRWSQKITLAKKKERNNRKSKEREEENRKEKVMAAQLVFDL